MVARLTSAELRTRCTELVEPVVVQRLRGFLEEPCVRRTHRGGLGAALTTRHQPGIPSVDCARICERDVDLQANEQVCNAIGGRCSTNELAAAVDQAHLDCLAQLEAAGGFRQVRLATTTFFRDGSSGSWRNELTAAQVAAIEADHGDVMGRLGYEPVTPVSDHLALAEARASRRRQADRSTLTMPDHLGLSVTLDNVPHELPGATRALPWLQVTDRAVRVDFGANRALLVQDGTTATVQWDLAPGDDPADLSWVAEGWAVTLAALQRGNLTLHASTVAVGDTVVAIAGNTGAGKSTTAMGMRSRGHDLLVDDSTLVEFTDLGAWTTPYARNVHLMADTAAAMGVDFDALPRLAGRADKSSFRPEPTPAVPRRLKAVIVVAPTVTSTSVTCTPVAGADRVALLRSQVSRHPVTAAVLGPAVLFNQLTRLADACDIWLLRRPTNHWSLDGVLDAIENLTADERVVDEAAGQR
jgi:hypothetical protein